jgi:acetyltransferase-like isoleucine patch superfamily enzyme
MLNSNLSTPTLSTPKPTVPTPVPSPAPAPKQRATTGLTLDRIIGGLRGLLIKPFFKQAGFPITVERGVQWIQPRTIRLGNRVQVRYDSKILPHVTIHNSVFIGPHCDIGSHTVLEDNVTLADYVCILGDTHDYTNPERRAGEMYSLGETRIGKGAWIGYRVIILPQVRSIGPGAVIGAGSVVTKDIPAHCVAVGNPARVVAQLDPG